MTDGPAIPSRPDRAGWYDDPDDSEQLRYFDGILWTDHVTPRRTVWSPAESVATDLAGSGAETAGPSTGATAPSHTYRPPPQHADGPFGYPPVQGRADHPGRAPHTHYGPRLGMGEAYVPTGPTTDDGTPLATMWARFGAWFIDSVITWALGLLLGGYLLYRGLGNYPDIVAEVLRSGTTPDTAELASRIQFDFRWLGAFAVTQATIGIGYHTFFLSRRLGATPGKRIVRISVRRIDRPGVLSVSDALRRSMVRPVLWLFTYTPLLSLFALPLSFMDVLFGLWDPKRQTLHDKLGRTVVVQGQQFYVPGQPWNAKTRGR